MSEKSKWQVEYEALPEWARGLVDAAKGASGYSMGNAAAGKEYTHVGPLFKDGRDGASKFMSALGDMFEFKDALSAPWPPPSPPSRILRAVNVVEMAAGEDDSAFDQPCCFGHRVEQHAVYCHNSAWPDSPRKCRRNRRDYLHEDCPGFVANPDNTTDS